MKLTLFGFVALSVVTLALPVFATTRGYDVQVRNHVAVAITIQITQYHAHNSVTSNHLPLLKI
jgi:hypothetical protein